MSITNQDAPGRLSPPLLYVDIGLYFSGTNPILLDGISIIQWLNDLSCGNQEVFIGLIGQLSTQLLQNGLGICSVIYQNTQPQPLTTVFESTLGTNVKIANVTTISKKEDVYAVLQNAREKSPLLLGVQGRCSIMDNELALKIGISVGLISERSLISGDRLLVFLLLSIPHLESLPLNDDLLDAIGNLSSSLNINDEIVLLNDMKKSEYAVLEFTSRILSLLPSQKFKFGCTQSVHRYYEQNHVPVAPAYEQIAKDLYPIKDDYEGDEKKEKKKLDPKLLEARKNQKFMAAIHTYASSLQGANHFFRNVIVAQPTEENSKSRKTSPTEKSGPVLASKSQPKSSNKPEKKSKAQLIKEENEARLKEQELAKYRTILATAVENCAAVRTVPEKLKLLDNLKLAQGTPIPEMNVAFLLAKMNVHVSAWKEDILTKSEIATSNEDADFVNAVAVLEKLYQIFDEYLIYVNLEQLEGSIIPALCMFGFVDAAEKFIQAFISSKSSLGQAVTPVQQKKLTNLPSSSASSQGMKYSVKHSYTRFQLLFCGHLFPRSLDAVSDSRVLFRPDAWQVSLLDAVDNNESALICAPTSSGKTFICYYAMEKILRTSNDDMVIYIAPNKALMNQVAADVYARFQTKTYPSNSGQHLFGMLSDRDILHPFDCQILVTFPEVFERFAMSPLFADLLWTKKVKYLILDEIHTIGEAGRGAAWEKIISLAQCPVLALSATIGNRYGFWHWLSTVQSKQGIPCRLIEQHERFSDLKRYIYQIGSSSLDLTQFENIYSKKKKNIDTSSKLIQMHPLASLTRSDLVDASLPLDFQFLPGDTIRLVETLSILIKGKSMKQSSLLDYQKHFGSIFRVTKLEMRKYENQIKSYLAEQIREGSLDSSDIDNLVSSLGGQVNAAFCNTESSLENLGTVGYLESSLLPLLVTLAQEDKLPVIVFHMDRNECSNFAVGLINALNKAEAHKRERYSKEDKSRISEIEKQAKAAKRARDAEAKKPVGKDAWMEESLQADILADLRSGLDKVVDPELAFQDPRYKLRDSDLDELIDRYRLTRRMTSPLEKTLLFGLRRGIGVHHRGVPKKYLELVEHLFRLRHLQVVVSTSTLALGINMPCKSVVFSGDDLTLTPLTFRQMSGRAGRRGYDDLGHVIFHGLSKPKVDRLIASVLPSIRADSSLSAVLPLQLSHVDNPQLVSIALARLIASPLSKCSMASTEKEFARESKPDSTISGSFHMRLLTDALVRFGLLSPNNNDPLNSNFVPSVYARLPLIVPSQEPGTLILMYLLKEGWIDAVCAEYFAYSEKTLKSLMLLFASLFQPRYLPHSSDILAQSNTSKQILDSLPIEIQNALQLYNGTLLSCLSVALSHSNSRSGGSDQIAYFIDGPIPDLASTALTAGWYQEGALILDAIKLCSINTSNCILRLTDFPFYAIPPRSYRNNYLTAYYSHGDSVRIARENQVSERDLWQDLYEIDQILKQTIACTESIPSIPPSTREALKELSSVFEKKFKRMWA